MAAKETKKETKAKETKAKKATTNPFARVAATKSKTSSKLDIVRPQDESVRESVDQYKRIAGEIKSLEGEQAAHKSIIEAFGRTEYARRALQQADTENFSITGDKDSVSMITANASKGIAADDYARFVEEWGQDVAEDLLHIDTKTVKFDSKVLAEPGVMDQVVSALQTLPADLLDRLFTKALYTVTPAVAEKARSHADSVEKYENLLAAIKITQYVKG